jgi:acyl carrier protein
MSVASRDLPQGGTTRLHSEAQAEAARAFLARLDQEPANERQELLVELVCDRINQVLRRNPDKSLDRKKNLMDLGLDSLMAVELRDRLSSSLALEQPLPATLIFDYPNVEAVASFLRNRIYPQTDAPSGDPGVRERVPVIRKDIASLSDEEVEALINERLGEDTTE